MRPMTLTKYLASKGKKRKKTEFLFYFFVVLSKVSRVFSKSNSLDSVFREESIPWGVVSLYFSYFSLVFDFVHTLYVSVRNSLFSLIFSYFDSSRTLLQKFWPNLKRSRKHLKDYFLTLFLFQVKDPEVVALLKK